MHLFLFFVLCFLSLGFCFVLFVHEYYQAIIFPIVGLCRSFIRSCRMLNQMMSNGSGWMGLWIGTGMAVLGVLVILGIVILVKTLLNTPQPSVKPAEKNR